MGRARNEADVTREAILNLWEKQDRSPREIAALFKITTRRLEAIVSYARKCGDKRAVKMTYVPPPEQSPGDMPAWRYPDYSGMSLTALLFGDPARGRSALDMRQAARG